MRKSGYMPTSYKYGTKRNIILGEHDASMDQITINFNKVTGRDLRDAGISQAAQHAEKHVTGWRERAMAFCKDYARRHGNFSCEDMRQAARGIVPEPPHLRAWGSVMVEAAKQGIIYQAGYIQVANPAAHRANAALWRSKIFKGV